MKRNYNGFGSDNKFWYIQFKKNGTNSTMASNYNLTADWPTRMSQNPSNPNPVGETTSISAIGNTVVSSKTKIQKFKNFTRVEKKFTNVGYQIGRARPNCILLLDCMSSTKHNAMFNMSSPHPC